jgi:hypothetical protein
MLTNIPYVALALLERLYKTRLQRRRNPPNHVLIGIKSVEDL